MINVKYIYIYIYIYIYYRVVRGEDKLNTICDDVIIVLHYGQWSALKCAYEVDYLPWSKSRG